MLALVRMLRPFLMIAFALLVFDLVKKREALCRALGLTTRMAITDLGVDDPLLLPRLDTNYPPMAADAPAWTWDSAALKRP